MNVFNMKSATMDQLQTWYSHLFGEPFPLRQYMSLYDNWEAKNLPAKSEPTPNPKTDPRQTTEGKKKVVKIWFY